MPISKVVTLSDGAVVPRLAFGTATAFYKQECSAILLEALKRGFRHIDTAESYMNEESVGTALKEWGGRREEIFITTKFGTEDCTATDPRTSLIKSLRKMEITWVDLYLVHYPPWLEGVNLAVVWRKMEQLKEDGLCRSIGVSNFSAVDMAKISPHWTPRTGIPTVNQVEVSPFCAHVSLHRGIMSDASNFGIAIAPYSCLSPLFRCKQEEFNEVVVKIASNKGMTQTQVLLAWALQTNDGPVVTITTHPERCDEYLDTFDFELAQGEIDEITLAGSKFHYRKWT